MKDFISKDILINTANAIRACENSNNTIAPKDFADRIRALDNLVPQPDALNFYMPNGGTITLNKIGTPTQVELEYSIDRGKTWTTWTETNNVRSLTLHAGGKVYIRNASETSTEFSKNSSSFYNFAFTTDTNMGGNINSLLCKIPSNASLTKYCYAYLFNSCTSLTINDTFALIVTTLVEGCYYSIFRDCNNVNLIRTNMTDISATNCVRYWLHNVSPTGDFYCPAELTIPTDTSGIPSGWTRHDI